MNLAEINRLRWLIVEVDRRGRRLAIERLGADEVDLLLVTTSMVESALRLSRAIQALINSKNHLEAGPLERSLWEIWDDLRYLLRTPGAARNATKALINAELEVADFLARHPRTSPQEPSEGILRMLARHEKEHPDVFAEVVNQRRNRLFHWSGLARAARLKGISDATHIYRVLSWDVHSVMGPIRDISIRASKGKATVVFNRKADKFANAPRLAFTCGGILFHIWNEYAAHWKMQSVRLPEDLSCFEGPAKTNRAQPRRRGR